MFRSGIGWPECADDRKQVERRDNEVGAPENRIEWLKPYPDAPARTTSITGTWIDRRRSAKDYNEIRN
jgi:hypothetical protein